MNESFKTFLNKHRMKILQENVCYQSTRFSEEYFDNRYNINLSTNNIELIVSIPQEELNDMWAFDTYMSDKIMIKRDTWIDEQLQIENEKKLRDKYSSLKEAFEKYQVLLGIYKDS